MARPVKQPEEKRRERFNLRFTLKELNDVQTEAAKAGMLPHEYARRRVLGFAVQPPPAKADAAIVAELNRIGVNVNQLARAQNADKEFRGDWRALEIELQRVLEKVATVYADAGLIAQLGRLAGDLKELAQAKTDAEFIEGWQAVEAELRRALKRAAARDS